MACGGLPPREMDLVDNNRGFGDSQSPAAVFFRDERGHVSGLRNRLNECIRVSAFGVELAPVCIWECTAQLGDGALELLMKLGFVEARKHSCSSESAITS